MLVILLVSKDLEVMVIKRLMHKHMLNGSNFLLIFRIDYLKYDNCYHPNVTAKLRYYQMYKALN